VGSLARLLVLIWGFAVALSVSAIAQSQLPDADRARLVEAARFAGLVRSEVWPGWERTAMPVLLVTDSLEYLVGVAGPAAGFAAGADTLMGSAVRTRLRQFPPTLLATFPAVGGTNTIVVGPPERTGKTPAAWIVTLLHEHFHQWQYTQPDYHTGVERLDLARGDSTAQWMLDYPFPYDDARVGASLRQLGRSLAAALVAPVARRANALEPAKAAITTLRSALTPPDRRYLEFQLWQEGVARYIEYAVMDAAATLGDSSYSSMAASARRALVRELGTLDPKRDRRVTFYPIGAAIALVLEDTRPNWKRAYAEHPFMLTELLVPRPAP
jgi:hypothetical protein